MGALIAWRDVIVAVGTGRSFVDIGAWLIKVSRIGGNAGALIAWNEGFYRTTIAIAFEAFCKGRPSISIDGDPRVLGCEVYDNRVGSYNDSRVLGYRSDSPYISALYSYTKSI